jgi:hypothetical protein
MLNQKLNSFLVVEEHDGFFLCFAGGGDSLVEQSFCF